MAIYVNDSGTLRQVKFLAVNDGGVVRRVNEVYVNDNGSLAGPFTATHETSRNTATTTSTISGVQNTVFNTNTVFDTDYNTTTTFDTSKVTTFNTTLATATGATTPATSDNISPASPTRCIGLRPGAVMRSDACIERLTPSTGFMLASSPSRLRSSGGT